MIVTVRLSFPLHANTGVTFRTPHAVTTPLGNASWQHTPANVHTKDAANHDSDIGCAVVSC
jgi:hypothetical protein